MKRLACGFAALFVLSSCWAPVAMQRVAAVQAPGDLQCPAERVSSYPYGHHLATEPVYRGCGRIVVYHCLTTVGEADTSCAPIYLGMEK